MGQTSDKDTYRWDTSADVETEHRSEEISVAFVRFHVSSLARDVAGKVVDVVVNVLYANPGGTVA